MTQAVAGGLPFAEFFERVGISLAEPAVELRLVLELLAARSRHDEERAIHFREGCDIAPEFFELDHGEDVLLAFAPAFLDVLEGDVGGHALGHAANRGRDLWFAGSREELEQRLLTVPDI